MKIIQIQQDHVPSDLNLTLKKHHTERKVFTLIKIMKDKKKTEDLL